jgi:hypothetical protein
MTESLSRAERIEKEAAKFSDLAEGACSPFLRGYYLLLAKRHLALESSQRGTHTAWPSL